MLSGAAGVETRMIRVFSQYVSAKSLLLILLEGFIITLSLCCAAMLRFWNSPSELAFYVTFPDFAVQIGVVVIVCLACFYYNDLYDVKAVREAADRTLRLEQSLGAASLLLGILYCLFPRLLLGRGVFIIGMSLVTGIVVLSRKALDKVWLFAAPVQRVVIMGTGELALALARELTRRDELSLKLEGFVGGAAGGVDHEIFGFPVLGSASDVEAVARRHDVSRVIVALEDRRGTLPTRQLVTLKVRGVRVDDGCSALAALTGRIALRAVKPSWFVFSDGFHRSKWNDLLKRIVDLSVAVIGLLLSLPVMLIVALAVRLDSKGPIIYRQTRVGGMGKHFEVLKFRSMRVDAERESGAQWARDNDPRTTRVGRFLRKYRLDELPQFLNVIRGDMSFVGPRPERPCFVEELRKAIPYYDERHSVRPGLTGWAQVQYQYGASIEDAFTKLEYDLFYLKNMSITFDLAIIFKTIRIVFGARGGR
jgi:sugar transferase (PEP-CTERM system associated)